LLFIIFINDASDQLNHLCKQYADDTKLLAAIRNLTYIEKLQADISTLVYLPSDLKWKNQAIYAAHKANQILGMLKRTFMYFDVNLFKLLYCTFVRPHLEFAISAWCPNQKGNISKLENVQRRATKLAPAIRNLSYEKRLEIMGLTTLEERREIGDLIQAYKIINGHDHVNWCSPESFQLRSTFSTGSQTRSHRFKITEREIVRNCEFWHQFFTNRCIGNWNSLPAHIV
jgi:ribonuclease P/MRP protein subunit RPP40